MSVTDLNRLRWRCRRGMRELDILLNGFLERQYQKLSSGQQHSFTRILDEIDQDILDWIMDRKPVPDKYTQIIELLRETNQPH
jgi:antitoxin CptB